MYDEYFGLKETPFSIAPDPRFLYMSELHRDALAHLVYGISTDGGFVLLSGEVGTGKTTLSRCLLEQIPADTHVALILNPKLIAGELLANICDELGIDYPEYTTSIKVFVDCITDFLLKNHARGRKTVVLIEEGQNLDPDVLEQLRLLTNLETNQRKLMQIIIIGQPELLEMLNRPELRQLSQRITARYHLMPLDEKDTADYVKHRLLVAGAKEPVFPPPVLRKIHQLTGGIPRKINILCDRAMLGAYTRNLKSVDIAMLDKAANEVFGITQVTSEDSKHDAIPRIAIIAVSVGLLLVALVIVFINADRLAGFFGKAAAPALGETSIRSLQWLDTRLASKQQTPAFTSLFREWDTDYINTDIMPCDYARLEGLACLEGKGSLTDLRQLNRPAVVGLLNNAQQTVLVTLSKLDDETALVRSGSEEHRFSRADLLERWQGEYTILWRAPPGYQNEIKPGSRGPDVNWLADRLSVISGRPAVAGKTIAFDSDMIDEIKAFQQQAGLEADGAAGAQTLIYINSVVDQSVPKLQKANTRQQTGARSVAPENRPGRIARPLRMVG